jgi:hypothetical protein
VNPSEVGTKVEREFQALAFERFGVPVIKSSLNDDMFLHVDYWISNQGYDVKARRSVRRHQPPQDEFIYLELSNIRGDSGWLFGQADFIAFEQEKFWIISPRKKLVEVARKYIKHGENVDKPEVYKIYTRAGRKDRITLMPTKDIYLTEPTIWSKVQVT